MRSICLQVCVFRNWIRSTSSLSVLCIQKPSAYVSSARRCDRWLQKGLSLRCAFVLQITRSVRYVSDVYFNIGLYQVYQGCAAVQANMVKAEGAVHVVHIFIILWIFGVFRKWITTSCLTGSSFSKVRQHLFFFWCVTSVLILCYCVACCVVLTD